MNLTNIKQFIDRLTSSCVQLSCTNTSSARPTSALVLISIDSWCCRPHARGVDLLDNKVGKWKSTRVWAQTIGALDRLLLSIPSQNSWRYRAFFAVYPLCPSPFHPSLWSLYLVYLPVSHFLTTLGKMIDRRAPPHYLTTWAYSKTLGSNIFSSRISIFQTNNFYGYTPYDLARSQHHLHYSCSWM